MRFLSGSKNRYKGEITIGESEVVPCPDGGKAAKRNVGVGVPVSVSRCRTLLGTVGLFGEMSMDQREERGAVDDMRCRKLQSQEICMVQVLDDVYNNTEMNVSIALVWDGNEKFNCNHGLVSFTKLDAV